MMRRARRNIQPDVGDAGDVDHMGRRFVRLNDGDKVVMTAMGQKEKQASSNTMSVALLKEEMHLHFCEAR